MAPYDHTQRSEGAVQNARDSLAGKFEVKGSQPGIKRDAIGPGISIVNGDDDGIDSEIVNALENGIDNDIFGFDDDSSTILPSSTTSLLSAAGTLASSTSLATSSPILVSSSSSSSSSSTSTSFAVLSSTPSATLSETSSIVQSPAPVTSIIKGLYTDDKDASTTITPTQISTSTSFPTQKASSSASVLGDAPTSVVVAPLTASSAPPTHPSLSQPAHNILVAAAVIGGLVLLGTIVYFILRFMNISVKTCVNTFTRRRPASWRPGPYGGLGSDTPPYATFPGEKPLPITRKLHTPIVIPPTLTAQSPSVQELAQANNERQNLVREALREDPQPFLADPDPFEDGPPAYEIPASHTQQTSHPPRRPSTAYGLDRHTSYLSSLSSGFGDLKIDIPESGPTKPQNALRKQSITDRISRNNFQSRFSHSSWISNPPTPARSRANSRSNRDTVYTAASEESTPRFRTVSSWVSQQARRAQRQQDVDREIDNMPEIPSQNMLTGTATTHQRQPSEATESIFGFHPGDQVPIAQGKRVSSKILDRIL